MLKHTKPQFLTHSAVFAAFIFGLLWVWASLYTRVYLNTDLGWLFTCLERFWEGGTYLKDFYETNPPLSFLIYLPGFPLYLTFGIHPSICIILTFIFYLGISLFFTYKLLVHAQFSNTMIIGLLTSFIFTQTWLMGVSFGQKDHLIFIFLIPFCLYESLAIAEKKIPRYLAISSLLLGAFAICIKPHYLLLPAIYFIYRFFSTRSIISVISSLSFIVLTLVLFSYIIFVIVVFPEYAFTVFPQVLDLYQGEAPLPVINQFAFLIFSIFAFVLSLFTYETDQTRYLRIMVYSLIGLSLLCALPYIAQNKGFHYHALPMVGFSFLAFLIAMFGLLYQTSRFVDISIVLPIAALIALFPSTLTGKSPGFLTNQEFRNLLFVKKLDSLAWNNVYASYLFKPLYLSIPYYSDLKSGSRFGQIWPVFALSEAFNVTTDETEREKLKASMKAFIDMIAEDMARFKPSVIAIPRYEQGPAKKPSKAYFDFLMKNDNFRNIIAHYDFVETFTYDEYIYERGDKKIDNKNTEMTYDLFVLKKDSLEILPTVIKP